MSKIKITDKNFCGRDEYYGKFFECPKCGYNMIIPSNNYCGSCGKEIDWQLNKIMRNWW